MVVDLMVQSVRRGGPDETVSLGAGLIVVYGRFHGGAGLPIVEPKAEEGAVGAVAGGRWRGNGGTASARPRQQAWQWRRAGKGGVQTGAWAALPDS